MNDAPDSAALWGGQARGRNGAITRVVKRHCDRGVGEELPTARDSPRSAPTLWGSRLSQGCARQARSTALPPLSAARPPTTEERIERLRAGSWATPVR